MAKIKIRVIDAYVFRKTKEGIKYLILKRAKTKMYEHLWQGVAGKIEKGEQAWEAAIRELKEETDLDPKMLFVADHISKFYEKHGDRINFVPVFGVEVDSEIISLLIVSMLVIIKITNYCNIIMAFFKPLIIKSISSIVL